MEEDIEQIIARAYPIAMDGMRIVVIGAVKALIADPSFRTLMSRELNFQEQIDDARMQGFEDGYSEGYDNGIDSTETLER